MKKERCQHAPTMALREKPGSMMDSRSALDFTTPLQFAPRGLETIVSTCVRNFSRRLVTKLGAFPAARQDDFIEAHVDLHLARGRLEFVGGSSPVSNS